MPTYAEKLLDNAVKKCERPSFKALAERVGVTAQTISQFKLGIVPMPDERIVQFAKIAGEDPDLWLLIIKAEQTHGEAGRAWARLARKFGAAAAVFVMLCVLSLPSPAKGFAQGAEMQCTTYTLCEVRDVCVPSKRIRDEPSTLLA